MEFTDEMLKGVYVPGKGMPIYLDERPPELEDPAQKLAAHHWQPACTTTNKLTRCLEAIRDVATALKPLSTAQEPDSDKRLIKQLIPPIYNLAIAVRDLFNYVQSNRWKGLDKKKHAKLAKRFKQFSEAVPTGSGILKTARDKIGAHLDKDVFTTEYRRFWDSFGIADVLKWIRGCLRLLQVLLLLDIYSWTRSSGYSNVVNLMNVDGKEVSILMKDGEPTDLVGIRLTVSPREGFVREANELAVSCAAVAQHAGIGPEQLAGPNE